MRTIKYGLLIISMWLFTGCIGNNSFLINKSINTNLIEADYFNNNTTKDEVIMKLGKPIKVEQIDNKEVLHFCSTGTIEDNFLAVIIEKEKFFDKKRYLLTAKDMNYTNGHCSVFVKNFEEISILEQKRIMNNIKEKRNKQAELNKIEQFENEYLSEYKDITQQVSKSGFVWIQPKNKNKTCKVNVKYSDKNPLDDYSYKLFWDGDCKDGYAYGLGRVIEKANLIDSWRIGIYENGNVKGASIDNDILHDIYAEGESNYDGIEHKVIRNVFEKDRDINLFYVTGIQHNNINPGLVTITSPFMKNKMILKKMYPNFEYRYTDFSNDTESQYEFEFSIINKDNKKNGWAYNKLKSGKISGYIFENDKMIFNSNETTNNDSDKTYKEFITNNKNICLEEGLSWSFGDRKNEFKCGGWITRDENDIIIKSIPNEFYQRMENIVLTIKTATDKAILFQNDAQLIKKQYLKKLCRNNIKVDFMDNDEYKEICENKYEKELFTKINNKLQKITEEKIAKLKEEKYQEQKAKEEQYRQQQLAIEEQKLAAQRRQATAAEDASDTEYFNQSLQNLNNQLDRMNSRNNFNQNRFDASKQENKKYYYIQPMGPNLYYVK